MSRFLDIGGLDGLEQAPNNRTGQLDVQKSADLAYISQHKIIRRSTDQRNGPLFLMRTK